MEPGGPEGRSNVGAYHPLWTPANRDNPCKRRICFDFVSAGAAVAPSGEVSVIGALWLVSRTHSTGEVAGPSARNVPLNRKGSTARAPPRAPENAGKAPLINAHERG